MALLDLHPGRLAAFLAASAAALFLNQRATRRSPRKPVLWEPIRYVPGSVAQRTLFAQAAAAAGLPAGWASDADLVALLGLESDGWVGIPNYQYGLRKKPEQWPLVWAQLRDPLYKCPKEVAGIEGRFTCATGMGQLTPANVDKHYPTRRAGIGDPLNEAVGMLSYIAKRYGSPTAAKAFHDEKGWY